MRSRARASRLTAFALACAAAVGGAVIIGTAAPAQAHNFLVGSTPAAGEVVTVLPDVFSVTTNGPLLDLSGTGAGFTVQVTDAAGAFYGNGCMTVLGSSLSTPAELGAAGSYRLVWQVISEDGHTVSDELTFEWSPAADFEPAMGQAAPPVCGAAVPEVTPTPTAEATAPVEPEPTSTAIATPDQGNADLTDVLWIGGAVLAVLIAAAVALIVVSRRNRRADGPPTG